jgi:uncharacterized protein
MKPDYERAKQTVLAWLSRELSPHLTYHSLQHTRDDVLPAAERLGRATGIDSQSYLALTTAALFHDTGFLFTYQDHETQSIAIAGDVLPQFGYTPEQIALIADLIAATRMPQRPHGLLQELLCDADLDLLGRDDFMRLNRALYVEVRHYSSKLISEATWLGEQTRFLEDHHFFTTAANELRAEGKAHNLILMRAALASLNGHGPGT